jgi:Rrf2 family protein
MCELARHYGKGPVTLHDISKSENLSEKYLSLLVIPLRQKGLIRSIRGAQGGYQLTKPPQRITAKDVVEIFEDCFALVECNRTPTSCRRSACCPSREVWKKLGQQITRTLRSVTLKDMTAPLKAARRK